jgi:hypothetical protein
MRATFPQAAYWLLLVLLPISAVGQPSVPIEVVLSTPASEYRSNNRVPFVVVVRNGEANRRLVLPGQPGFAAGGGFDLVVVDSQGIERSAAARRGDIDPDPVRASNRRLVLDPGHGFGFSRIELASDLFPRPGRYQVYVAYRNPRPGNGGEGNDVQAAQARSNTIDLTIVDR